ncbi:MAG TPA: MFS transporter [Thermococcus paralvinellae]|uniref:MFS transporter n=1 Tax=Thermococcus paralvinellae TaxID=582419 RepID=A0A832ZBY8_9EURY|nr:MFS transporter [Thermococcus paralvinellae]
MPVGDLANLSKYSKITLLLATIVSLGKSIIDPIYIAFLASKTIPKEQIGLLLTIYFVCLSIFDFPTGAIADKWGRKRTYLSGVGMYGCGLVLYGTSTKFELFAISEILLALGSAFMSGSLIAWYYSSLKKHGLTEEAKCIFGLVNASRTVCGVLAGLLAYSLVSFDMACPFLVGGIIMFVAVGFGLVVMEENHDNNGSTSLYNVMKNALRISIHKKNIRYLLLGDAILSFALIYYLYSWQLLFVDELKTPAKMLGIVYIVGILGSLFGNFLSGFLLKRSNGFKVSVLGLSLILASYTGFALSQLLPFAILCVFIYNAGFGTYSPAFSIWLNEIIPDEARSSVLSLNSSLASIAAAAGSSFLGFMAAIYGIKSGFLVLTLPLALAIILFHGSKEDCKIAL